MGKKKKKARSKPVTDFEEAKDEMLALQSIYDNDFSPSDDEWGFTITIVPHPGEAASNHCSVDMEVRFKPFQLPCNYSWSNV